MRIEKDFTFDAAHALPLLPLTHKCHRMHGHTYRVTIALDGNEDDCGMVVDYDELEALWAPIHDALDHRVLNDIRTILPQPTTEALARWIADYVETRLRTMKWGVVGGEIIVHESSTTRARCPF